MTEDTLAFIREDMRREETRTVDLHALLDSVAADLSELGHDIAVADSDRVLVACRPVALRRALRNLLENAAAYGALATARIDRDGSGVRVIIEDEGPGVPEADLERVSSRSFGSKRRAAADPEQRARARHRAQHRPRPRRRRSPREPRGRRIARDGHAARRRGLMSDVVYRHAMAVGRHPGAMPVP